MKFFILTAGDNYYPRSGTRDWIASFETIEEAEAAVTETTQSGDDCYLIGGTIYDWYEIIDLRKWVLNE